MPPPPGPAPGPDVQRQPQPAEDNGIKGFDHSGEKLSEADEAALEAVFDSLPGRSFAPAALPLQSAVSDAYIKHLGGLDLPADLILVVDCAHGATAPWAPCCFAAARSTGWAPPPTGPASTWGWAPPTWTTWPSRSGPGAPIWGSPSTATATAA